MSGVETDGVDDGIDCVLHGFIRGSVVKFKGDAVSAVHPGIGDADVPAVFCPGIHHFHAVDILGAVVRFVSGKHLEKVRTGNLSLVGRIPLYGQFVSVPVEAEIRIEQGINAAAQASLMIGVLFL